MRIKSIYQGLLAFFLFFSHIELYAAWTCWPKNGERPLVAVPKQIQGKSISNNQIVCQQDVYCASISAEARKKLDDAWAKIQKERLAIDDAANELGAMAATEHGYFEAGYIAILANPYLQMGYHGINAEEHTLSKQETDLLEKNKIEARISCPGKLAKKGSEDVTCPPPDLCHGGDVIEMKRATTAIGGFQERGSIPQAPEGRGRR